MPRYLIPSLAAALLGSGLLQAVPTVGHLRCEDLVNPTGVEIAQPRFSWWMDSTVRGDTQTAYQVVVDGAWDSGKVASSDSLHIAYSGTALQPGKRYQWRARIWDATDNPSEWSETASFATGIPEWTAQWIGQDSAPGSMDLDGAQWIWFPEGNPAASAPVATRYFKREFTLPEAPTRASCTITADNGFEIFVNGTKAGEGNNFTHPGTFDIAPLLQAGSNVITVTALNIGTAANPAGLLAGLSLAFPTAADLPIKTDAQWQASTNNSTWTQAMVLGNYGMPPWGQFHGSNPARYLRKEFNSDSGKQIARATAYASGLGFFDLFINGQEISDHVMDPALSDYSKTSYYVAFDVTDRIQTNANAVGVALGNGRFFAPRLSEPAPTQTFGYPKLLLQIEIEYTDGSKATVTSDDTWKLADEGPIIANNEYDGEEYDARQEMPGWDSPGYDDSAWDQVSLVNAPGPVIASQMIEPMRVTRVIQPVAITSPAAGKYIIDMGENFYGIVRLKASAPAGTLVSLTSAYSLNPNGTLKTVDNRGALCTDRYTFKGQGQEIWTPRFKGQGFRRFEVSGLPTAPTLANFEGLVISTDVETTGEFECSDPLLNDIHKAVQRGMRMFLRSAPLDPDRDERQAWMGDPAKDAESGAYNFNVSSFYSKWMDDVARSQRGDGSIPDVSMYWNWGDGVEWASVFTILPDWIADFYGNPRTAAKHYEAMKTWVLAMRRHEEADGTLRASSYGDWCDAYTIANGGTNGSTNGALISSAYQYHNYRIMEKLAISLGHTADAATFDGLADNLKTAFNARFYTPATHVYQSDTQCAYVLALKFGLVPDVDRPAVLGKLVDDIMVKNRGHLTVGLVGMQWLMQVLGEEGRSDVAWTIATRTARPSWGYMLSKGATTIWERWDGDTRDGAMNSEALLILAGNLDAWFYQYLAGIRPASTAFKSFVIQPEIVGDLTSAKAHFDSPYGRIASEWQLVSPTELTFTCTVPANSSAIVHVPVSKFGNPSITESGTPVWSGGTYQAGAGGIGFDGADAKAVRLSVGAGTYRFRVTGSTLTPPGTTIIVDNDSPYARLRGSWTRETVSESDQRFGASFAYAAAGTGSSSAEFRPAIPATGRYKVQARWTSHANRASNTPFTIRHADGVASVNLNQEQNGGSWGDLGTFKFNFGSSGSVTLTNSANEYVVADAVRFVPVDSSGASLILRDTFNASAVASDVNVELANRQSGSLAIASWRANANNTAAQTQVSNVDGGAPAGTLFFAGAAGQNSPGEALVPNLASATDGKLVIELRMRCRSAGANPANWLAVNLSNAPFAASPTVPNAASRLTFLSRANGGAEAFVNGGNQGAPPTSWTTNSAITSTLRFELSNNAGTGSPFIGQGTVAKVYNNSGTLMASYTLTQMSACYLHLAAWESQWDLDQLEISSVAAPSPYLEWIGASFPGSADPALIARDADSDGDGLDNITEFALNGNPASGANQGANFAVPDNGSGTVFTIAARRGLNFAAAGPKLQATLAGLGLVYTVEGSLDLASWNEPVTHIGISNTAPSATGLPDLGSTDWEYHRFRITGAEGIPAKGFLRSKVTSP